MTINFDYDVPLVQPKASIAQKDGVAHRLRKLAEQPVGTSLLFSDLTDPNVVRAPAARIAKVTGTKFAVRKMSDTEVRVWRVK